MSKPFWRFGAQTPQDVSKPVPPPTLASADAKKFGLENYCNNCYVNSVVQTLYFCAPFRELMLQSPDASRPQLAPPPPPPPVIASTSLPPPPAVRSKPERKQSVSSSAVDVSLPPVAPIPPSPPSLFSALRSLFAYISTNPAERGTVSPRVFIDKLKELNRMFDTTTHQDAHEFLNYLLNRIVEEVEEEHKTPVQGEAPTEDLSTSVATLQSKPPTVDSSSGYTSQRDTLVHKLFEGALTSETRCLTCETVSSRDESFLDLSIDIEQNSSVTACLRQFSASEMLCHKNKFFCDSCCDLQEAEKRMKIKRLPNVLALHLKRFKYQEDLQRYVKLAYRVAFPFELRLFNTVDDSDDADRLYNLFGIVVHIGNGPHHGHYVSIVKTMGTWLLFDDDTVSPVAESDIPKYFGDSPSGSAYVLYYQAADIDPHKLGLRTEQNSTHTAAASTTSHPTQAPIRPPGLIPEEGAVPGQPHTPSSSSVSDVDSSLPLPHSTPILIPSKPGPPPPPMSTSASTSHSTASASASSASPSTSPLASILPSSPLSSSKASVSNLFKTIRKSPSISVRTGVPQMTGNGTTPTTSTASSNFPFTNSTSIPPVPVVVSPGIGTVSSAALTPTQLGAETLPSLGQSHPVKLAQGSSSEETARPVTTHGRTETKSRAPLVQQRPATAGHSGGQGTRSKEGGERDKEKEKERDRDKEKEKEREKEGAKKWFWRTGGPEPMSEPALTVNGSAVGSGGEVEGGAAARALEDVDPNTYANGSAVSSGSGKKEHKEHKEKDKSKKSGAGAWFGKRKSFRIGEKALKGLVGSNQDTDPALAAHDDNSSVANRFRTSLHLPHRREPESIDGIRSGLGEQASTPPSAHDDLASPRSPSPKHRPRPLSSTNLKQAFGRLQPHTHGYGGVNGDVSPAASSKSSFDSVSLVNSTPIPVVSSPPPMAHDSPTSLRHSQSLAAPLRHHSRPPLPRPPSHVANGYPGPPPLPRLQASVSASPSSPTVITPNTIHTPPIHTPITGFPHKRTLPHAPPSPATPERQQSLGNHPRYRGRGQEQAGQEERVWDSAEMPLSPLRSTASSGHSGKERDRPLPAVPTPTVETGFHHNHQRQGSTVDSMLVDELVSIDGSAVDHERSPPIAQKTAPGLGSFGSTNTSAASNGSGHTGFKRATKKLTPMLGFGKKDKDKDKTREKAPSSSMRV